MKKCFPLAKCFPLPKCCPLAKWYLLTIFCGVFLPSRGVVAADRKPCHGSVKGQRCLWVSSHPDGVCGPDGRPLEIGDARQQDESAEFLRENSLAGSWLAAREESGPEVAWRWTDEVNWPISAQGCYSDRPNDRDLRHKMALNESVTPEVCVRKCRESGYRYAGVQFGSDCYCDDRFGTHGTSQLCSTRCHGDANKLCGGWNKNFVYRVNGSYASWSDNQPNNSTGNQACGSLSKTLADAYELADNDCTQVQRFVCRIPFRMCGRRDDGYIAVSGRCYVVSSVGETWFRARNRCLNMSGDLVALDSPEEHRRVGWLLRAHTSGLPDSVWVGLTKKLWRWPADAEGVSLPLTFTNFADGEPRLADSGCVYVDGERGGRWFEAACDDNTVQLPSVCMFSLETTTSTTTSTTTTTDTASSPTTKAGMSVLDVERNNEVYLIVFIFLGIVILLLLILVVVLAVLLRNNKRRNQVYDYSPHPVSSLPEEARESRRMHNKLNNKTESGSVSSREQVKVNNSDKINNNNDDSKPDRTESVSSSNEAFPPQ